MLDTAATLQNKLVVLRREASENTTSIVPREAQASQAIFARIQEQNTSARAQAQAWPQAPSRTQAARLILCVSPSHPQTVCSEQCPKTRRRDGRAETKWKVAAAQPENRTGRRPIALFPFARARGRAAQWRPSGARFCANIGPTGRGRRTPARGAARPNLGSCGTHAGRSSHDARSHETAVAPHTLAW